MEVAESSGDVGECPDECGSGLNNSLVGVIDADCLDYFWSNSYYIGSGGGIARKTGRKGLVDVVSEVLVGGSLKPDRGTVSRIDDLVGMAVAEVGAAGEKLR